MTFDYIEFDAEDEYPSKRSLCNEKFDRNFKIGKFAVKCSWTLVYTDSELNLDKSKANCKAGKNLNGKNIPIKTPCGSIITMNLDIKKKTTITSGTVTSVGEECTCFKASTTTAATTTDTATTTLAATTPPAKTTSGGKGKGSGSSGGNFSPPKNIFSPRFMNECVCIEQGALKKIRSKKV